VTWLADRGQLSGDRTRHEPLHSGHPIDCVNRAWKIARDLRVFSTGMALGKKITTVLRTPLVWRARFLDWQMSGLSRHELAICAIFREEAPFLREWIEFHVGVGVTHFYLYNNFSTDQFRSELDPFIRDGLVTLTDWPVPVGQLSAYRDCLKRHRMDARWIAFIDIDEFLFSPIERDVRRILAEFNDKPGVHVWQFFFGSSGHPTRSDKPLLEAFTQRASETQITTVKTIANPRAVYKVGVHESKFFWGTSVDTNGKARTDDAAPVFDRLRLNHYWSRSLADLDQKVRRGDASTAKERDRQWHFAFEARLNSTTDTDIIPLAASIRAENMRKTTGRPGQTAE
jgi:hypothetical protein